MQTAIHARRLWTGEAFLDDPLILIEDGRIRSIASGAAFPTGGAQQIDFPQATLTPAFFDIHIHGGGGHDLMEATPEAVAAVSQLLPRFGTGAYLATTVTAPLDKLRMRWGNRKFSTAATLLVSSYCQG